MSTELANLTCVTIFTAILWLPYTLNMIMVRGLMDAVGYPETPKPLAPWAERLKCAHYNAVENLIIFAPLILIAHALGVSNSVTAGAATVYLWARIIHPVIYMFAIPFLRTLIFVVGFGCQIAIGWQIFYGMA